jgi:hypothetical protein
VTSSTNELEMTSQAIDPQLLMDLVINETSICIMLNYLFYSSGDLINKIIIHIYFKKDSINQLFLYSDQEAFSGILNI